MKKLAALLTAVLCLSVFAGCGGKKEDLAYIKDNGEMVMGITLFEPMNYYDENGELIGFETEFATAVCEKLGVEPKFQVIDWEQKENELNSKAIDCIWNGFTVNDERRESMAFSTSYVRNRQVTIIRKTDAGKYVDVASMAGANMIAENGSAGQEVIQEDAVLSQNKVVAAAAQKDALLEVKAGTSDIAVLDYIMANAVVNNDSDFSDLMIVDGIEFAPEEYAVGFRKKDTELVAAVNKAIDELVAEGTMAELAKKYGLTESLLLK